MSAVGIALAATVIASPAPQTAAHVVDLRTMSDAQGRTEISFCSRPSPDSFGFPGHAFVAFYDQPLSGPTKVRIVGHTIGSTATLGRTIWTYFDGSSISGRLAQERYTHMKQACLTVVVDRADFARAMGAARPTLTAIGMSDESAASLERYTLNGNDCVDFVVRVARTLEADGLHVPTRQIGDLPAGYIERLGDSNL